MLTDTIFLIASGSTIGIVAFVLEARKHMGFENKAHLYASAVIILLLVWVGFGLISWG